MNKTLQRKLTAFLMNYVGKWIPDEPYLKILWRLKMATKLDLKNPVSFNEKLQWLKLNDRKPLYTRMVDKSAAKEYVASIIGGEHIIPTIGSWDCFEEIDFAQLPQRFVLKCTHDSGGLCVCRDKNTFNIAAAKIKLDRSMKSNFFYYGREWPYKDVPRKIICEQYMQNGNDTELKDYKFYCFNGEPRFLYVSEGLENHETARISFVTLDWKPAPFRRLDYAPFEELPRKPDKFDEMVDIARMLAKDTPFLRVDLYEINGEVYFGELTFTPCAGFMPLIPDEWDDKLGELLRLPIVH